jgi:ABC-type branched-subunit amino acid transport system ATPase component
MTAVAIRVAELTKRFGIVTAFARVDLKVAPTRVTGVEGSRREVA